MKNSSHNQTNPPQTPAETQTTAHGAPTSKESNSTSAESSTPSLNRPRLFTFLTQTPWTAECRETMRLLSTRETFANQTFLNRRGRPWTVRDYQRRSLESWAHRKVHCDGRDVGKTSEIEIVALWAAIARPREQMLIATPCENHLFPLMDRIARRLREVPALREQLDEMKRTPSWYVRFRNGFTLWGRIAGPDGVNFQGLHVDWQIVDEAQEMPESAWRELYPGLNGGGRRWVYGVPNGIRNTYYRMTQDPAAERHHWPAALNPEFTPERDAELIRLYGGRNAPAYVHQVLGEHGAPAHGVFDLDDYQACVDPAIRFREYHIAAEDPFDPPYPVAPADYYLGCDLGYARDPSEFVVYRVDGPDLVNVLRVRLTGVHYARQQDIVAELDEAYNFRRIGIDAGNNGRAVAHGLMSRSAEFCGKIESVEFGSAMETEPLANGTVIRRHVKQFMTELLERRMRERTLRFPRCPDREAQYAAHTYREGPGGRVIYEKGDDHIIDADRCAILAHYLDTTQQPERGPLGMQIGFFKWL